MQILNFNPGIYYASFYNNSVDATAGEVFIPEGITSPVVPLLSQPGEKNFKDAVSRVENFPFPHKMFLKIYIFAYF